MNVSISCQKVFENWLLFRIQIWGYIYGTMERFYRTPRIWVLSYSFLSTYARQRKHLWVLCICFADCALKYAALSCCTELLPSRMLHSIMLHPIMLNFIILHSNMPHSNILHLNMPHSNTPRSDMLHSNILHSHSRAHLKQWNAHAQTMARVTESRDFEAFRWNCSLLWMDGGMFLCFLVKPFAVLNGGLNVSQRPCFIPSDAKTTGAKAWVASRR